MIEKHLETVSESSETAFEILCDDLSLQTFQLEHLDAIYNLTLEPEIRTFLPDWISTKEQRLEWMIKYDIEENKHFIEALPNIANLKDDPLRLAIVLRESNEVIGWIVSGFKEELAPPNREIGYAISNQHTGKGYATQAARALIEFLFEKSDTESLVATARTYNEPSNRVLKNCGYRFEGTLEIDKEPYNCYRMTKSEWLSHCK